MAEETITILKVGTEEAVKNISDLRANIKALKEGFIDAEGNMHEGLNSLEIGTQEYMDTLDELKVNQNALKDAMYATSSSMEDVAKAATGANIAFDEQNQLITDGSVSYNELVHAMANLKEEFRSTTDAARRADLGTQIKSINDELKRMDASQGNFQRNVGNYANSIKEAFGDMSQNIDIFGKSMGFAKGGIGGLKDGFDAFSKSPGVAIMGVLVSVVMSLAGELKENETAMAAIKKALASLKPIMDFFSGIIENLAEFLADIIGKVTQFITSNGLMDKIVKGVMGVGNAILKYVTAPFKGVIEAIKVFKEQGIKGIGDAAKAFGQEMKQGFSFKENFKAGQQVAETIIAGAKSKKKKAKQTGKEIAKEVKDGFLEDLTSIGDEIDKEMEAVFAAIEKEIDDENKKAVKKADERLKALDKSYKHQLEMNSILVEDERERAEKEYQIQERGNKKKLDLIKQFMQDALDRNDWDAYLAYDQERADLEVEIETNAIKEKERLRKLDLQDAEKTAKAQKDLLKGVASSTSDILGTIADLYENDEENSEKNANKIKGLRIAAATIDTISGAIGAYMQASQTIPPPYGQIVGAAAAAAVTASGLANIAKLKSTKVSGSSGAASVSTPAVTSAPTINTNMPRVRSVTSATEEDRLNQMAKSQRVYILADDIQASQNQIKTQVSESSF